MKKSKANPLDAVVPFPRLPRKRQSFHKENSAIDEGLLHLWGSLLDFSAASDLVSENVTCRSRKIYCWNDLHLMNYTRLLRALRFKPAANIRNPLIFLRKMATSSCLFGARGHTSMCKHIMCDFLPLSSSSQKYSSGWIQVCLRGVPAR